MSLIKRLRDKPSRLTVASKYTALNGIGYLVVEAILIVWPGVTQTGEVSDSLELFAQRS